MYWIHANVYMYDIIPGNGFHRIAYSSDFNTAYVKYVQNMPDLIFRFLYLGSPCLDVPILLYVSIEEFSICTHSHTYISVRPKNT